ncbi:MAG: sigma-70 family RNA polymerase sigma factor [Ketobacter sp.]|nr:MAG: sigma-70 family RNA polymerase sigma factor [Ketobacter sp.]
MFQWSSLTQFDSLLNDEDESLEVSTAFVFEQEAEGGSLWDDGELATRDSATNMASHALLSREEEQHLAYALQRAFKRLQQSLTGFPNALSALTDHLSAEYPAELDDTTDQLLTLADLLGVMDHLPETLYEDRDNVLWRMKELLNQTSLNRDWLLETGEAELRNAPPAENCLGARQELADCINEVFRLRNKFITANVRLVYHIAKRHRDKGMEFEDMVQEGTLGLLRAALKFDASAGVRFGTYAFWWIQQSIRQAVAKQRSLIRYPTHISHQSNKVHAYRQRHRIETGSLPGVQEVARHTGLKASRVKDLLSLSNWCVSADTPLFDDGVRTLLDELHYEEQHFSPEEGAHQAGVREYLTGLLQSLSEREAAMVAMRYGIGHHQAYSLNEISVQFGLSKERVRQIVSEALASLIAQTRGGPD